MTSDTRQPLLDAREVTVRFGGLTAVDAVSARFMPGELVGIIGPNGAGKSTLLAALMGVLPITRGQVRFGGQDIARLTPLTAITVLITLVLQLLLQVLQIVMIYAPIAVDYRDLALVKDEIEVAGT